MNEGKERPKKTCIFFRVGGIASLISSMTRREERRHESPEVRSEESLIFGEKSCLLDSVSYEETKKLVLFFCVQKASWSGTLRGDFPTSDPGGEDLNTMFLCCASTPGKSGTSWFVIQGRFCVLNIL
jgi:hypothetical protein